MFGILGFAVRILRRDMTFQCRNDLAIARGLMRLRNCRNSVCDGHRASDLKPKYFLINVLSVRHSLAPSYAYNPVYAVSPTSTPAHRMWHRVRWSHDRVSLYRPPSVAQPIIKPLSGGARSQGCDATCVDAPMISTVCSGSVAGGFDTCQKLERSNVPRFDGQHILSQLGGGSDVAELLARTGVDILGAGIESFGRYLLAR